MISETRTERTKRERDKTEDTGEARNKLPELGPRKVGENYIKNINQ